MENQKYEMKIKDTLRFLKGFQSEDVYDGQRQYKQAWVIYGLISANYPYVVCYKNDQDMRKQYKKLLHLLHSEKSRLSNKKGWKEVYENIDIKKEYIQECYEE